MQPVTTGPDAPPLPPRYVAQHRLGVGGMAEVWRAEDGLLGATVAIKVCRAGVAQDPQLRHRFVREATLTAQLRHPGIPSVHDRGDLPDGRPYFVMEEVRGLNLTEATRRHHQGAPRWTLRRLVEALGRACQAVAYAHSAGVLHRDLKPDNLMLGEFGQVHVVDWGLARPMADLDPEGDVRVSSSLGTTTQVGQILGSPAYMAPEQARGAAGLGPEVDVYALGACLYQVLTGRPPYLGSAVAAWRARLAGPPEPVDQGPEPLRALVARCMATEPDARPADAGVLAREVEGWLDGDWRMTQADARVAEAETGEPAIAALRADIARRRAEAVRILEPIQPSDPAERKEPAWILEAEAARAEAELARLETERVLTLRGALALVPEHAQAHALLARQHAAELLAAEARGDAPGLARAEALLREHGRSTYASLLRREGALTLDTDPSGAEVWCATLVDHLGRLAEQPPVLLGHTPLVDLPLPAGSHVLTLRQAGHHPARYPIWIGRDQRWNGAPPDAAARPVPLPPLGTLGPQDCYVPAGPTWVGGDSDAFDAPPRTRLWIPGFVIRRFPVTNGAWLAFRAAAPSSALDIPLLELLPDPDGTRPEDHPDRPVAGMRWAAAVAFAEATARAEGLPWRLPHEWEWEKAARGVDGRRMPWGDRVEPTWANQFGATAGPPLLAPVDAYPTDLSPYGVRGLAGGMRTWCNNVWRRHPPELRGGRLLPVDPTPDGLRASRGGAWQSISSFCRPANRFGGPPETRFTSLGLRLCRSWPALTAYTTSSDQL